MATVEGRFRLFRYPENSIDGFGKHRHAGDLMIERLDDGGKWCSYDGPYAPQEKSTAQRMLRELQLGELPQIFD